MKPGRYHAALWRFPAPIPPDRSSCFMSRRTVTGRETPRATSRDSLAVWLPGFRSHEFGLTPARSRGGKDAGAESDPKKVSDPPSHLSGRESEPEGLTRGRLAWSGMLVHRRLSVEAQLGMYWAARDSVGSAYQTLRSAPWTLGWRRCLAH